MRYKMLLFTLLLIGLNLSAQTITIEITNIRSSKGQLLLGVYTNQPDYRNKIAIMKKTVYKVNMKEGTVTTTITGLKPGTYGIALLDDEDYDREMAFRFFLPAEGFAFSDYYHTAYSRPVFDDFKFELGKEDKKIVMKVRYL